MLPKHSFHSIGLCEPPQRVSFVCWLFFRVPRDLGLTSTNAGWHSSVHVFFVLLSVLVRNVGSEGRLGLNPSSATYKFCECEYFISLYSHWIGSCLLFDIISYLHLYCICQAPAHWGFSCVFLCLLLEQLVLTHFAHVYTKKDLPCCSGFSSNVLSDKELHWRSHL